MEQGQGDTDWFGNPLPASTRPAVPCPRCGVGHHDRATLIAHLRQVHRIEVPPTPDAPPRPVGARLRRWWATVGHLPLWWVVPVDAVLVTVVVAAVAPYNAWYAAYAGGLATLPLVVVLNARLSHG